MNARRSIILLVLAALTLVAHEIILSLASDAHVAHRLLAGPPPIDAAILALALLVVRLVAIVLVPGAVLASVASLFAHVAVGPIDFSPSTRERSERPALGELEGKNQRRPRQRLSVAMRSLN